MSTPSNAAAVALPQTPAQSRGRVATSKLPIVAAAMFGLLLLYGVGFAMPNAMHNAAHDGRHVVAFPCH